MARRRLITRGELASLGGVRPPTITKHLKNRLKPACVGKKVWLDHPVIVEWLAERGYQVPPPPPASAPKPKVSPAQTRPRPSVQSEQQAESAPDGGPELSDPVAAIQSLGLGLTTIEAEFFADMTLERIAREYGTMSSFESVLKAVSTIAQIRERDDKHRREEGSVITRELVTHAFGELEKLSRHLLKPVPDTIIARAIDMHTGGKGPEEIRRVGREIMGSELNATWSAISAMLRKE